MTVDAVQQKVDRIIRSDMRRVRGLAVPVDEPVLYCLDCDHAAGDHHTDDRGCSIDGCACTNQDPEDRP